MAIDTYSDLKSEIEDYLDRDDLTNKVDSFIRLAEARHAREIRIREMEQRSQATLGLTKRHLALPARYEQMRSLRILSSQTSGARIKVKPKQLNLVELEKKARIDAGIPCYFTVHEEIEFDRPPEVAETVEMIYFAHLQPLSDSNPANALLTRAPDAYLYAALVAAEPFLVNDERITLWNSLYSTARDGLNLAYRKSQFSGPVSDRVAGSTP